jgi:hypothetical protein
MVDLVLVSISAALFYKSGWIKGYGAGEDDSLEYGARYSEYLYEQNREAE